MGEEGKGGRRTAEDGGGAAGRARTSRTGSAARRAEGRAGGQRRAADAGGVRKKSSVLVREGKAVKCAAIADWAASDEFPVAFMCRQLGVSRSGYYAWLAAVPSQRTTDD